MKKTKKMVSFMLVLALLISMLTVPAEKAQAAAKASVTKAVHLYVGEYEDYAIQIIFAEELNHVENLKTSSKNLKAKVTQAYSSASIIGLYTGKRGTYTVSFDIYNDLDEKVSSHTVKVYANTDHAIKSATFAGKPMNTFTDKTKGKLSVTMNKGYTLKRIEIQTYDKTGKVKRSQTKNNSTIELGKYAQFWESGAMYSDYYNVTTSLRADTFITVYYTDKYTKLERFESYAMYRLAE